jgi:hypothetical protein
MFQEKSFVRHVQLFFRFDFRSLAGAQDVRGITA